MARVITRFNIQTSHADEIAEVAAKYNLSKSEIVNRAINSAGTDPKTMICTLLDHNTPRASEHKPATYSVDPAVMAAAAAVAAKLHMSKDLFTRLALDHYLQGAQHGRI